MAFKLDDYTWGWYSTKFRTGTVEPDFFTELSTTNPRAVTDVYGNRQQKLGRVKGQINPTANLVAIYEPFSEAFTEEGFMDVVRDLTITLQEGQGRIHKLELIGMLWLDVSQPWRLEDGPLMVTIPCNLMALKFDGKHYYKGMSL